MSRLGDYLTAVSTRRRVPGEWDCCAFPADWIMSLGLADPMAAFRGLYSTEAEGEALIAQAGGLAALFAPSMDAMFEVVTGTEPQQGDVAVIATAGHEAGAIYVGPRWAFVLSRGLGFMSVDPECIAAMWRVSAWAA